MRYLRYGFMAVLALVLVVIATANRAPVTLRLFSDEVAVWLNVANAVQLPLYLIIFGGIIGGVTVGFIWEWFREHRQRAEAGAVRRERARLEREVSQLRAKTGEKQDDVLALLEG